MRLLLGLLVLLLASPARADLEAEARALVARWVEVQNRGDFAAYQTLYAQRFAGIRRSGPREVHLDRAGWMKDRGRMFAKPMRVEAGELSVHAGPQTAQVRLVQRFEQGHYKDEGRKFLVLVREAGQWRIAREEMETSTIARAQPSAARRAWLHDGVGVVLATGAEVEAWVGRGAPGLRRVAGRHVALRPVDATKLSAALRALEGRTVQLIDAAGRSCNASLGSLRVSRGVTPHFGEVQAWKDEKAPEAKIAADVLAATGPEDDRLIALASCPGAILAREGEAPAVVPAQKLEAGADREAALAALARQPAYRKLQADYEHEGQSGSWVAEREVLAFDVVVQGKPERWISVGVARRGSCGEWGGALWGLFRRRGNALEPIAEGTSLAPRLAADLDGDGTPELVYDASADELDLDRGILWGTRREDLRTPFHDCGC